jgi:hypothetical protein
MDTSILWGCLIDDVDDTILLEGINPTPSQGSDKQKLAFSNLRACRVIRLRRDALRNLQQKFIQLNKGEGSSAHPFDDLTLRGVAQVFRMTLSMTSLLNRLEEV